MNEIKAENKVCENPISEPRKRQVKTTPITLRMPKWWLRRLDKAARSLSLSLQDDINHCDLMRDVIYCIYINPDSKALFPRNCVECSDRMRYEEGLKLLRLCFR